MCIYILSALVGHVENRVPLEVGIISYPWVDNVNLYCIHAQTIPRFSKYGTSSTTWSMIFPNEERLFKFKQTRCYLEITKSHDMSGGQLRITLMDIRSPAVLLLVFLRTSKDAILPKSSSTYHSGWHVHRSEQTICRAWCVTRLGIVYRMD